MTQATKSRRGFASMDPEAQRKIASIGGKSAHQLGVAHEFTSATAKAAGMKGAAARAEKRRQAVLARHKAAQANAGY
jgi:general stress protein YciG